MIRWASVILYTLLIYAILPFSRGWQRFLRETLGDKIGLSMNLLLFFGGFLAIIWIARKTRALQFRLSILVLFVVVLLGAQIDIPEERIHLLQYGILGYLISSALRPKLLGLAGISTILLIGTFIGLGDEMIQWILPSRVFDWWDVGYNFVGIAFGTTIFHLLKS